MGRIYQAPTRRALLAAVGAAGATALAGCQSGEEPTGTSAGDPTGTPGAGTTPDASGLPPGTSDGGIDDVSTLVSATQAALRANDYAVETTVPLGDGETVTITIRSSLSRERQRYVFDAPSETNRRYVAGGTSYLQATAEGETTYRTSTVDGFAAVHEDNDQVSLLNDGESLGGLLRSGAYTPAGTVTRDGRRLREFTAEWAEDDIDLTLVAEAAGALVSADGVVFAASLPYTTPAIDGVVDWSFTIRALGDVTVSEPDWVQSA